MVMQGETVGPLGRNIKRIDDAQRALLTPPRRITTLDGIELLNSWTGSTTSPLRLFIGTDGWMRLIGYLVSPANAASLTIASFPDYAPELTWRVGQELSVSTATVAAGSRWLEVDTSGNIVTNATLAAAVCTVYANLSWYAGG